jgi:hypothetical protein
MSHDDPIDRSKAIRPESDRDERDELADHPPKEGNETAREQQPNNPLSRLKFGNAGSGGAELEPGPEKP